MPDATTTYAVDNTADVNVVAQTNCNRIVVQENFNSANPPTADLLQKMPATAAAAINIPKGTPAVYTPTYINKNQAVFIQGQIVGTIRTASGSITVQQVESTQI